MDQHEQLDLPDWVNTEPPLPPLPPEEGEPRRRREPPRRPPQHGNEGMVAMVAGILGLVAMSGVQMAALRWSARGGYVGAALVVISLIVLFLGPFIAGSIWIGRRRSERDP